MRLENLLVFFSFSGRSFSGKVFSGYRGVSFREKYGTPYPESFSHRTYPEKMRDTKSFSYLFGIGKKSTFFIGIRKAFRRDTNPFLPVPGKKSPGILFGRSFGKPSTPSGQYPGKDSGQYPGKDSGQYPVRRDTKSFSKEYEELLPESFSPRTPIPRKDTTPIPLRGTGYRVPGEALRIPWYRGKVQYPVPRTPKGYRGIGVVSFRGIGVKSFRGKVFSGQYPGKDSGQYPLSFTPRKDTKDTGQYPLSFTPRKNTGYGEKLFVSLRIGVKSSTKGYEELLPVPRRGIGVQG